MRINSVLQIRSPYTYSTAGKYCHSLKNKCPLAKNKWQLLKSNCQFGQKWLSLSKNCIAHSQKHNVHLGKYVCQLKKKYTYTHIINKYTVDLLKLNITERERRTSRMHVWPWKIHSAKSTAACRQESRVGRRAANDLRYLGFWGIVNFKCLSLT
jgi:hypothetical protein